MELPDGYRECSTLHRFALVYTILNVRQYLLYTARLYSYPRPSHRELNYYAFSLLAASEHAAKASRRLIGIATVYLVLPYGQ